MAKNKHAEMHDSLTDFVRELPEDLKLNLARVAPSMAPSLGLGKPLGDEDALLARAKEAVVLLTIVTEGYRRVLQSVDKRLRTGDMLLAIAEIATVAAGCSVFTLLTGTAQFWGKVVAGCLCLIGSSLVIISKVFTKVPGSGSLTDARATFSSGLCESVLLQRKTLFAISNTHPDAQRKYLEEVLAQVENRVADFFQGAAGLMSPSTDRVFQDMIAAQTEMIKPLIKSEPALKAVLDGSIREETHGYPLFASNDGSVAVVADKNQPQ